MEHLDPTDHIDHPSDCNCLVCKPNDSTVRFTSGIDILGLPSVMVEWPSERFQLSYDPDTGYTRYVAVMPAEGALALCEELSWAAKLAIEGAAQANN